MAETLASWVKRISDQEIPIFKYTVNAITDVVANEDTSTAELAQIILRDDGGGTDLGYTRTVQRSDGNVVTVYYFHGEPKSDRYIAATIWDPS